MPIVRFQTLFLASVLGMLLSGCGSDSSSDCTQLDPEPFLPFILFDGSEATANFQAWGARGVFTRLNASDLTMHIESLDPSVVSVDERSPKDAQATIRVRGTGTTQLRIVVQTDCGDEVEAFINVEAILPLGRVGSPCDGPPSGQWQDFWPMRVGNWWRFRYESREGDADGGLRRLGEMELRVHEASCEQDTWRYRLTADYAYVIFLNSDRDNTDQSIAFVDTVEVMENATGLLSIQGLSEVDQLRIRSLQVQRYFPIGTDAQFSQMQEWPELTRAESEVILQREAGPLRIALSVDIPPILQDGRFNVIDRFVASEQ